jgi:RHH-type transcriptional regulator, rel operon repressor / antitoxin RelB
MADTTTMTVRLSRELKGKLERLAQSTKRSKSYLAAEAIAEYVDLNAWQVEEIRKAVEKADAGGSFVADEDATRYLDALSRGDNPEPPKTFRVRPLARRRARWGHRDFFSLPTRTTTPISPRIGIVAPSSIASLTSKTRLSN